jgi:hypothetical protein
LIPNAQNIAVAILAAFWLGSAGSAGPADATRARQKIDSIETDKAAAGSRIFISTAEANAYAEEEAHSQGGDGVHNPRMWFGESTVSGSARLDFVKLQTARGQAPGWLVRKIIEGEREVAARVRVDSANGECRVDIEEVKVDGYTVPKAVIDILIEYYLMPRFPDAKIGQRFQLQHRVQRFEIKPQGVTVVIGR